MHCYLSNLHKVLDSQARVLLQGPFFPIASIFFLKNAKKAKKNMSGAVPASKKLIQSFQVTFTSFHAVAPAP